MIYKWHLKSITQFLLVIMAIGLASCFEGNSKSPPRVSQIGPFTLPEDVQQIGKSAKISPTQKLILVHFWASWCPPCQREMSLVLNLAVETKKKMTVVLVSGDESLLEMKKFLNLFTVDQLNNLTVLHDPSRIWGSQFGVTGFPESYLYGFDGKLVRKWTGELSKADLKWIASQ